MGRSQRHMLVEQNTTSNGEVHAEGEVAPFIVLQADDGDVSVASSYSPTVLTDIQDIQEPVGPPGGPLQGSYVSGVIPEGAGGGTDPEPEPDVAPVLTSLDPDTAVKDSPDFALHCLGSGFTETSVIMFAGQPEPIQFISSTDITTGVKPSLGWGTNTPLPVSVKNGEEESATLSFTFTDPEPEADEQDSYKRKKNHKKGK